MTVAVSSCAPLPTRWHSPPVDLAAKYHSKTRSTTEQRYSEVEHSRGAGSNWCQIKKISLPARVTAHPLISDLPHAHGTSAIEGDHITHMML